MIIVGGNFQSMSAEITENDVDCSVTFSEGLPEYVEEETERGRKNVIRICNGTDKTVYVELHPIEMVRRNKARNKNFGFGVDAAPLQGSGGVNVKVIPIFLKSENVLESTLGRMNCAVILWA